jgi:hypothetical protein
MQIPPGLLPAAEPFSAAPVLGELGNDVGLLVWASLRALELWIAADPSGRSRLFSAAAEQRRFGWIGAVEPLEPGIGHALRVLAGILGTPAVHGDQVAIACAALARWADAEGWTRTAFEAAARGALAAPRDPKYALLAGTMARRAADYHRTAAWLSRALRLARRAGDGVSHANALLAIAQIHMVRFEREAAEQALHRSIRAARRYGVWDVKPRAYHDLFCIQSTHGEVKTAAAYALAAAESYGLHHELLPALAHDLALFLAMQGRSAEALPLMEALAPRLRVPRFRLIANSNVARLAGAVGDRARFLEAWVAVWQFVDQRVSEDRAAEALVNLGWGAASLGDATRLEVAAREALRIAVPRQEGQEIEAAEEMLACLAEGRFPQTPHVAAGTDEELKDALAAAELLLRQLLKTPALRDAGIVAATDRVPM